MNAKETLDSILSETGVSINGSNPWDIRVKDDRFYRRTLARGSLGFGESYMDGWWECDELDVMFCMLLQAKIERKVSHLFPVIANRLHYSFLNPQSKKRAYQVAEHHYNFGNDMFCHMLGPSMAYSCGYWQDADCLNDAQQAKMEMIARKLKLKPGLKVLDIGCGWGTLAAYLAREYQVEVTGITVSREQLAYAREHFTDLPVTWILDDYRNLTGSYDRVVSVGMFEHVGRKNYRMFMRTVRRVLKQEGIFLLHTIGSNVLKTGLDPWIAKYIFPNGMLPSIAAAGNAISDLFIMEDWHNFGADYDKTLMAWANRFEDGVRKNVFPCTERQQRMFRYYLYSCAGAFRARDIQLWQIVLSPEGVPGGYCCRAGTA